MHLGTYALDDVISFYIRSTVALGGADFIAAPTWQVYATDSGTQIDTGSFVGMDKVVTANLYGAKVTLSTANGFVADQDYVINAFGVLVGDYPLAKLDHFRIDSGFAGARNEMSYGTIDVTTTPTSTVFSTLDITDATTDHYKDRVIMFTSGPLKGQAKDITAYSQLSTPTRGQFTTSAFTGAPATGNRFVVV